jgi:hypothetical protein
MLGSTYAIGKPGVPLDEVSGVQVGNSVPQEVCLS